MDIPLNTFQAFKLLVFWFYIGQDICLYIYLLGPDILVGCWKKNISTSEEVREPPQESGGNIGTNFVYCSLTYWHIYNLYMNVLNILVLLVTNKQQQTDIWREIYNIYIDTKSPNKSTSTTCLFGTSEYFSLSACPFYFASLKRLI